MGVSPDIKCYFQNVIFSETLLSLEILVRLGEKGWERVPKLGHQHQACGTSCDTTKSTPIKIG